MGMLATAKAQTARKSQISKLQRKRKMREERRDLLRNLDSLLPEDARRSNPFKTSGSRACGTSGRSLDNVLYDVVEYIRQERAFHSSSSQAGTASSKHTGKTDFARDIFLSSHSVFAAEVCFLSCFFPPALCMLHRARS